MLRDTVVCIRLVFACCAYTVCGHRLQVPLDSLRSTERSNDITSLDPLTKLGNVLLAVHPAISGWEARLAVSASSPRVIGRWNRPGQRNSWARMSEESSIAEEVNKMRVKELKAELDKLGVAWRGLVVDKEGLVEKLVAARLNPPSPAPSGPAPPPPSAANDDDDDVVQGQTQTMGKKSAAEGAGGGAAGAGNPFGGMGGMGGMPNMGGMGGMPNMGGMGGMPNMGGMGGGMPGMGDMNDMVQKVMSNPRAMELMQKMQSNPKIMKAMQEVQSNPSAMAKYASDPEMAAFIKEFQEIMG